MFYIYYFQQQTYRQKSTKESRNHGRRAGNLPVQQGTPDHPVPAAIPHHQVQEAIRWQTVGTVPVQRDAPGGQKPNDRPHQRLSGLPDHGGE